MSVELRVPQMGESIVEATILRWLKKEGETFAAGDDLVELETDKANLPLSAEQSGSVQKILHQEGEVVNVNQVLAILASGASDSNAPRPTVVPMESKSTVETASVPTNGRPAPLASPLAVRKAEGMGVDISRLQGSGISGRIVAEDVERAANTEPIKNAEPSQPHSRPAFKLGEPAIKAVQPVSETGKSTSRLEVPPPLVSPAMTDPRIEKRPMTRMRQAIAKYLKQAQETAAILTTFNEVDMSAVMDLRKRRKDDFTKRYGVNLGFMSFFTKATIGALKVFPMLNSEIQGTDILVKHFYDIGVAVSTNDGLVVPVVRNADRMSFAEIEKTIGELAVRAREKKLTLSDLQGGTFSITNGGVFGSLLSTPILNYPQVGILGMHKIQERPIALNGQVVIHPMMYLALSYDHRIVDGREAVQFLVRIKELLEDPETLLLEG